MKLLSQPDSRAPGTTAQTSTPRSSSANDLAVIAVVAGLVALYLVFVLKYAVNSLYWDDWSVVPLVYAAQHGHLSLSTLWTQHNENRILVPNLILVVVGITTADNTRIVMLLSALVFIASFLLLLGIIRRYLGRPITPVPVLAVGLVWFSFEDWDNALWGFQFAWYLILGLLIVMLYLLLSGRRGRISFPLAIVTAIAASFSSLQGLLLWPVGLLCLVWAVPDFRPTVLIRNNKKLGLWILCALLTTGIYFIGYNSHDAAAKYTFSPSTLQFILSQVGNVIVPSSRDLFLHELVGLLLGLVAALVCFRCFAERTARPASALPVTLIAFGLLFDLITAIGRVSFGVDKALASRYTMANLLIVVAIAVFVFAHLQPAHASSNLRRAVVVGLSALVVTLAVSTTTFGISQAKQWSYTLASGARMMVNVDKISSLPAHQMRCYYSFGFFEFVSNQSFAGLGPILEEAKQDHLSAFATNSRFQLRRKGLPRISVCPAVG